MNKLRAAVNWLITPASWQRGFWIQNTGILILVLGVALEVRFGIPEAVFAFLLFVGLGVFLLGVVNASRWFSRRKL